MGRAGEEETGHAPRRGRSLGGWGGKKKGKKRALRDGEFYTPRKENGGKGCNQETAEADFPAPGSQPQARF